MILPTLQFEQALWNQGYTVVAGVDEVGRGAWAGPVVAAAAFLAPDSTLETLPKLLRDSKLLSPQQRQIVVEVLKQRINWAIGQASVEEINKHGIAPATFLAMDRALFQLSSTHQFLLIDGFSHPSQDRDKQQAIVKGDAQVASIAAASVIAKVYRDGLMVELANHFPTYGFDQHKGYGTKQHQLAILEHGLTDQHRAGFELKFLEQKSKIQNSKNQ